MPVPKQYLLLIPVLFFVTWFCFFYAPPQSLVNLVIEKKTKLYTTDEAPLLDTLDHQKTTHHGVSDDQPVQAIHTDPEDAANSTLGFGSILVVSAASSPRRPHLIQAANVTGIDLVIPEQPRWTEKDVEEFSKALKWGGRETGRGSKLSWLAHDYVLHR